jgi:hypothetical protein
MRGEKKRKRGREKERKVVRQTEGCGILWEGTRYLGGRSEGNGEVFLGFTRVKGVEVDQVRAKAVYDGTEGHPVMPTRREVRHLHV